MRIIIVWLVVLALQPESPTRDWSIKDRVAFDAIHISEGDFRIDAEAGYFCTADGGWGILMQEDTVLGINTPVIDRDVPGWVLWCRYSASNFFELPDIEV